MLFLILFLTWFGFSSSNADPEKVEMQAVEAACGDVFQETLLYTAWG